MEASLGRDTKNRPTHPATPSLALVDAIARRNMGAATGDALRPPFFKAFRITEKTYLSNSSIL